MQLEAISQGVLKVSIHKTGSDIAIFNRKMSNIRPTKSQNLNVSRLDLQLSLHDIL